jgi:hypothetical protein
VVFGRRRRTSAQKNPPRPAMPERVFSNSTWQMVPHREEPHPLF